MKCLNAIATAQNLYFSPGMLRKRLSRRYGSSWKDLSRSGDRRFDALIGRFEEEGGFPEPVFCRAVPKGELNQTGCPPQKRSRVK